MKQECEQSRDGRRPFFFIVGAGISSPPLPLASEVVSHCRTEALRYGRAPEAPPERPIDSYSAWFQLAYPAPVARQAFLRELIQGKPVSEANLRLAHILSSRKIATTVVTPNFDDFLTRALTLFGVPHILCDHPQTTERIDPDAATDIQVVHVHGSYWFYDCCNLVGEVEARAQRTADSNFTMSFLLDSILRAHAPVVVGYSGWESDVIMSALKRRLQSGLPHNLYWFCYNDRELEALPDWLKDHRNVFVVIPEPAAAETPVDSALVESASDDAVLPGKLVFDTIIRTFGLETPELTRDPLEFLAQHLRASLYGGDVSESSDIYGIRSVIARLERAKEFEATAGDEATRIELIREAIRRSDYDEAVAIAASLKIEQMETQYLEQLLELITTLMAEADLDAPTLPYDILNRVNSALHGNGAIAYDEWERRVARLLLSKASQLEYQDEAGSIAAYDEIVTRFRESDDAELERIVAEALVSKAETLWSNLDSDAEVVADTVLTRYGPRRGEFLLEWARALLIKIEKAVHVKQFDAAVEESGMLLAAVDGNAGGDDSRLRSVKLKARYARARALSFLDRHTEAISEVETLLRDLQDASHAERSLRIRAHQLNADIRQRGGDIDGALSAFDSAIVEFGHPPDMRNATLARLLLAKSEMAQRSGRLVEATQAAEALIRQFSSSRVRVIRELVKRAEEIVSSANVASA